MHFLRVTIPADIYSSGIICEANNINIHVRVLPEEADSNKDTRRRGRGSHRRSPSGQDVSGEQHILPKAADLAESFLEAEPKEEKEELEAAISSQSQYLRRDAANLSDEEEEQFGLGDEYTSLPSFVAKFIKGVADRLAITVKGVSLRLDTELSRDGKSKKHGQEQPDLVSCLLTVGDLSIGAVSLPNGDNDVIAPSREEAGRRRMSLTDVSVSLISDPLVFSSYSRFGAPGSPATTMHAKNAHSLGRSGSPSSPPSVSSHSDSMLAMTRSTILERAPPEDLERDTEPPGELLMPGVTQQHMEETAYSAYGQFADAVSFTENRGQTGGGDLLVSSDYQPYDRPLDNPSYLDSVILDSQMEEEDEIAASRPEQQLENPASESRPEGGFMSGSAMHESGMSTGSTCLFHSTNSPSGGEEGIHRSSASLRSPPAAGQESSPPLLDIDTGPRSPSYHVPSDASKPSNDDDLSESRVYSHDEAQSMYMSAISHGPSSTESFTRHIPGCWGSGSIHVDDAVQDHPEDKQSLREGSKADDEAERNESVVSTPKIPARSESPFKDQPEPLSSETPSSVGLGAGRLIVAKTFLEIDKFTVWLPSIGRGDDMESDGGAAQLHSRSASGGDVKDSSTMNMRESTMEDLFASRTPGPPRTRAESLGSSSSLAESVVPSLSGHPEDRTLNNVASDLVVDVSAVALQFDVATGWLLIKMGKRLHHSFKGSSDGKVHLNKKQDPPGGIEQDCRATAYNLTLNKLTVCFVEHLPGCPTSLEGPELYHPFLPYPASSNNDVFLRITSAGWRLHLLFSGDDTSKIRLDVSKFAFGFATEDIVSFDEDVRNRKPMRNVLSPSRADISVTVAKSHDASRVIVTTLPLFSNLRIQRLEEALGWFGGLSTILEVGSSISSVSTTRGAAAELPKKHRSHGVRFQTDPLPPTSGELYPPNSPQLKVNIRIGGIAVDLNGEALYRLDMSALKFISRQEGFAVQIDRAKLTGPIFSNGKALRATAPASARIADIRVAYHFSPTEADLDRLLSLITPSKDKYDEDDDIMLGTLFRQRKQGAVFRLTVGNIQTVLSGLDTLDSFSQLANELSTLSTVTKYLPEDDRPGVLSLVLVKEFDCQVQVGGDVGTISVELANAEVAHISIPSLVAAQVGSISVTRNAKEDLLGDAMPMDPHQQMPQPVLMARFIADEMDPTVKIKLFNLRAEYTVSAMIAFLGIKQEVARGDVAAGMANSLANLGDIQQDSAAAHRRSSSVKSDRTSIFKYGGMKLSVLLRDCLVGLNPRDSPAKGIVVLSNARFTGAAANEQDPSEATLELKKASLMVIDDMRNVGSSGNLRRKGTTVVRVGQLQALTDMGYVPVSTISSAMVSVKLISLEDDVKSLDVEVRDDLLILESCADSTQTLISILTGLQPPTPPSSALKYRTEVMPIRDMLESFTGDAFAADRKGPGLDSRRGEFEPIVEEDQDMFGVEAGDEDDDDIDYVSDFPPTFSAASEGGLPDPTGVLSSLENPQDSFHTQVHVSPSVSELDFQEDHFSRPSTVGGTAHRWDSAHNTYGLSSEDKLRRSPLRVRVRDVHVIWNLFDGYDWQQTRDTISKAVKEVEAKATERRAKTAVTRASPDPESDDGSVIGDFLFNSIYIGIPANRDPRELNQDINREIDDDLTSETGSYATSTTVTAATTGRGTSGAPGPPPHQRKKLRLSRSKHHKMTFELQGVCADYVVFPPDSGETQSSLDVRVNDLDIFDHVPTSTWKKFATYMREAGEKESGTSMVHLEVLTVKPVPDLAASEIVLKAAILPLRLHVDQDALDFMCRFFEFRDKSLTPQTGGVARREELSADVPFLQRVEVHAVPVKLDFKPKRVDYAGLRSGRTTEFMNFFVLDEADMVLRHVIVYGVSGFDKLGHTLNDIWMPDIKRNQLPSVLAGLAPIRSLVNVGGGVKDLVVVPMREYKKDGRIVRSIQKGALSFAKTTSNELVKLGAKLAIGTQTVLQGAEDLLNAPGAQFASSSAADETTDEEEEMMNQISPYADQPVGVVQGLRGAFRGLERDLLLTRDAIVAVPGEVVDEGSATAAAKAVLKRTPTIVLRPAIGMTKAVGQTLLGAGNTLDPTNRRKMEDVSVCPSCCLPSDLSDS